MEKRTWVAILMLISIILIVSEAPGWWDVAMAALAGLAMTFAVNIIFAEIEKVKR